MCLEIVFLEKVKLYLWVCCCIIKNDVEKYFRTDSMENVKKEFSEEFYNKRTGLTDGRDKTYRRT